MVKLEIILVSKDSFSLYDIAIRINNSKVYNYIISSNYAYNLIIKHYRARRYDHCLAVLNKWKEEL